MEMKHRPRPEQRERFRKRLVWLYASTLAGVLTLLAAAILPAHLIEARPIGVALMFVGGLGQLWATWDYARRR